MSRRASRKRGNRATLLIGCRPELAINSAGRILGVGEAARSCAGRDPEISELTGEAWPGLVDAHIHLDGLAKAKLTLDLARTSSIEEVLRRVRRFAATVPAEGFVLGRGWSEQGWSLEPHRRLLDEAADGRPVILWRRDGHSAWLSTSALERAGVSLGAAVEGGRVEADASGRPSGIVRENAMAGIESIVPEPTAADFDRALEAVLRDLARFGLTSVHSIDPPATFASLQRLQSRGRLRLRVTYNLPKSQMAAAERLGLRSGWGDPWLRLWGVKLFLDGSLGSSTAEMLDGSGVATLPQPELEDLVRRAAKAELNVLLHAIGDGAVRRGLDALAPHVGAWRKWRPRIEHAQCVAAADVPRFAKLGVVASMQPIHAVADRELADERWGDRVAQAYAWRLLREAGAVLAFGSDAPVETADPLAGLWAATTWRKEAGWHPELALGRVQALRAYTRGPAYAVGLETETGALRPGMLGDVTIVTGGRVVATVVGGRISYRSRI